LVQLGEARVIVLSQQVETALRHVLEPLIRLQACQTKRRPAFKRKQIAGVAKELGDDLIGFDLWCWAGVPRSGAWGRGRRGLCERSWQQAGHRQDAGLARRRARFLTDQVADVLAHGLSQLTLEGGIGLGEGFGQVAQIMGLTKLMATVGQDRGHGWYQTLLLIAEHGQDGPL
jgi:hypothetical protein